MDMKVLATSFIAAFAVVATPGAAATADGAVNDAAAAPAGAPVDVDPGLVCQFYDGDGTLFQAYCSAPAGRRFQITATCVTASVKSPVGVVPATETIVCPGGGKLIRGAARFV